jgi:hypothetical protein
LKKVKKIKKNKMADLWTGFLHVSDSKGALIVGRGLNQPSPPLLTTLPEPQKVKKIKTRWRQLGKNFPRR